MTRTDAIIAARAMARRRALEAAWSRLHDELEVRGVEHRLFGSLARNDVRAHSDLDVMILGDLDPETMMTFQRLAQSVASELAVECDLIFERDHSPRDVEAILAD